jgi:hypothetical protein
LSWGHAKVAATVAGSARLVEDAVVTRGIALVLAVTLGACGGSTTAPAHASQPLAPDTADARAILEAADRKLAGYRSISLETAVSIGEHAPPVVLITIEAVRERDGKILVRSESKTSSLHVLEIIAGADQFMHAFGERSAKKHRFDPEVTPTPLTMTAYLARLAKGKLTARRMPDETIDGRRAFVLAIDYGTSHGSLYIDALTGITLKIIIEDIQDRPSTAVTSKIVLDAEIPRARFELPPDITIEN